jgi:hypothetical protein
VKLYYTLTFCGGEEGNQRGATTEEEGMNHGRHGKHRREQEIRKCVKEWLTGLRSGALASGGAGRVLLTPFFYEVSS